MLHAAHFGSAHAAAYGGFFIVLALLWGWWIDGQRPDRWDLILFYPPATRGLRSPGSSELPHYSVTVMVAFIPAA